MKIKGQKPIDLQRRNLIKTGAAVALGVASINLFTSIGHVNAVVKQVDPKLTELEKPRTFNGRPPGVPESIPAELFDDTALIPTKVFDNLYCIGSRSVVAWVLTTSAGIIVIDSMWDDRDGKLIIEGMKQLGLNPAETRYVLLTHGHGDHYGGAQYIKDKTDAEILLGQTDIGFMKAVSQGANGPRSPKPALVTPMSDGQKITLGDTTVTVFNTPGHTPGCMSLIFPVKQNGKTYLAAQWGGTGPPRKLKDKLIYQKSIDYFEKQTQAVHATVKVNAHLFVDGGYEKLEAVRDLKPGSENPWVIGEGGLTTYFDDLRKMISGAIAE